MILSTLDKSRKGGAYEQIPSLVLGQRWTPQLNSRNMMKVVLCVWIEPYIENDLSFCVWPVHTPTTSKEVLTLSASTSPLPYTGNKSCIVNTILSVMPKHTVYIDPCMGSAEVFFRKPRAEKEILNDYNGDLVNLFRVIQNNEKLAYLLGRLYLSINGELAFKQNKDARENRVKKDDRLLRIIQRYYIPHAGYVDCGFDSTTLLHSGKYIKYPKHSHCQRWMKRLTSKKTRRCTDLVRKGNEYRRLFDYWWTLY